MDIKFTRYENHGEGFKIIHSFLLDDTQSKEVLSEIKKSGFVRIKGSGIIGMTFEKNDLEKNTQITFERAVD